MADEVSGRATITCELGHDVMVERVGDHLEKQMHADSIEVDTDTGEETITYCPSCIEAANILILRGL